MEKEWSEAFDARHGAELKRLLEEVYPLRHDPKVKPIPYGTSGFRTKGALLAPLVFRVSALAVWRSVQGTGTLNDIPVGVILTASHNPYEDNGMKLLGTEGEFLNRYWEPVALRLGNSGTYDEFKAACWVVEQVAKEQGIHVGINTTPFPKPLTEADKVAVSGVVVHTGRDTRATGPELTDALKAGCAHFGAQVVDHGIVTTPLLHDVLWQLTKERDSPHSPVKAKEKEKLKSPQGGSLPEDHTPGTNSNYYRSLVYHFTHFYQAILAWEKHQGQPARRTRHIIVDCANGVGTVGCREVIARLEKQQKEALPIKFHLVNTNIEDTTFLNQECGADFQQRTRDIIPALLEKRKELMTASEPPISPDDISIFTLDGDADRVVAFYVPSTVGPDAEIKDAHLLDGERMSSIYTTLAQRLLAAAQLTPRIGVVQTAYANGASTKYITEALGVPSTCSPTGTKYSHHIAAGMDIGTYFESNGHGTMLFEQTAFLPKIKAIMRSGVGFSDAGAHKSDEGEELPLSSSQVPEPEVPQSQLPLQRHDAAKFLFLMSELLSQSCGDAIADAMAVECCLAFLGWTFKDWFEMYTDVPSVNMKVSMHGLKENPMDLIKTTENQRRITHPAELQNEIDRLVKEHGGEAAQCRSFVRPSGTEPIVRVYAEGATKEACQKLADAVAEVVKKTFPV